VRRPRPLAAVRATGRRKLIMCALDRDLHGQETVADIVQIVIAERLSQE
jgi:hypothetical protein